MTLLLSSKVDEVAEVTDWEVGGVTDWEVGGVVVSTGAAEVVF